jgi:hypothetical protein
MSGSHSEIAREWNCTRARSFIMKDIFWIAVTIAFFVASIAYVRFCDRVK